MIKRFGEILRHSLGLDDYGNVKGQRNHFVTGPGGQDHSDCEDLVTLGLMSKDSKFPSELSGGSDVYHVTDLGRLTVRETFKKPEKRTRAQERYQAYIDCDSGLSFIEWLKSRKGREAS